MVHYFPTEDSLHIPQGKVCLQTAINESCLRIPFPGSCLNAAHPSIVHRTPSRTEWARNVVFKAQPVLCLNWMNLKLINIPQWYVKGMLHDNLTEHQNGFDDCGEHVRFDDDRMPKPAIVSCIDRWNFISLA